jgi:hypothetical protein
VPLQTLIDCLQAGGYEEPKNHVAILHAKSNRFEELKPLAQLIAKGLEKAKPGDLVHIRL